MKLKSYWMLLGIFLVLGPAVLAEEVPESTGNEQLDRIYGDLKVISDNLVNIKARFKNVAGKGIDSTLRRKDEQRTLMPVKSCCGVNIEKIKSHTAMILDSQRQLAAKYKEAGNVEAEDAIIHSAETLRNFYTAFLRLEGARDPGGVEVHYQTTLREFNHFRKSLEEYRACCVTTEPPSKKKKKRSKKKDNA